MKTEAIGAVTALCEELRMPAPVAALCARYGQALPEGELEPVIAGLLEPATAEAARQEAQRLAKERSTDGLAELFIQLLAACAARERYRAQGWSDQVFLDTMGCFPRFVEESRRWYGDWRFDRGFWSWRQLSGLLVRLGTLEFERLTLPETTARLLGLPTGAPAISIHIPSDATLTPEALAQAYALRARRIPGDAVYCQTWLLSPRVGALLPEGSGIRNFQAGFELVSVDWEDNAGKLWAFGGRELPNETLPENTSLQRGLKALLLSGQAIGEGLGRLRPEAARA